MATSALDGKGRVYNVVKAALTGQACDVTYGPVRQPPRNWVMVGSVNYDSSDWAAIGAHRRRETYAVELFVNVIALNGTTLDAETAALGLVDLVESAFRADPSLGGLAVAGVALVPRTIKSQYVTDGAEAQWEGVVRISEVRI